jgi:hypothetical protein
MRMDIDIRVKIPKNVEEAEEDLKLEFVEGVMELFRKLFPDAEPLPHKNIDTPAPVTVTMHEDEEDA